jgi:diguanylate cyclase (GGDEF)-like protein/PAS domain S-box-containing protein
VIIDPLGRAVYASPSVERIMGYGEGEWRDLNVLSLVHPDDAARGAQSLSGVIASPGLHPPTEIRLRHRNGAYRMIELVAQNLMHDPVVQGIVYNARDVTERHEAEEALREREERFRALVQDASDLITVVNDSFSVTYQSPSIRGLLGWEPEDIAGRPFADIVHADDRELVMSILQNGMDGQGDVVTIETKLLKEDGTSREFEIKASDLRHVPSINGIVLNTRDVTDRKALERQLRHQAFHDPLTDLANRVRFTDRLDHALLLATRRSRPLSVIFMDIDNFKAVNDSMGHPIGDQILKAVALRVQGCLRVADTAARFGGDEFAILLEDMTSEGAVAVAKRIIEALREPFVLGDQEVFVWASLGIASNVTGMSDNTELLRQADIAMYVAKRAGKGRYEVYDQSMRGATRERLELLSDLQRAKDNGEFIVHYQPTVNLSAGTVVGVEALVRWQHPTRDLLLPDQFIGLAEESGVIIDLGQWVLGEACKEAARLQQLFPDVPALSMNVNVSVKQLQHPDFVGVVAEELKRAGLDARSLVLEVTESVMMQDMSASTSALRALKDLGVRIAIDDFGTGYSSLGYLRQFPVDVLKIDRSFVEAIGRGSGYHELLRTILELSKTLSIVAVAEGIELEEQLRTLREMDCAFGQGFLYSKPLPAGDLESFLKEHGRQARAAA